MAGFVFSSLSRAAQNERAAVFAERAAMRADLERRARREASVREVLAVSDPYLRQYYAEGLGIYPQAG